MILYPIKIYKNKKDELCFNWNDGTQSTYNPFELRIACPCASCVNEWTGEKLLNPKTISKDIKPKNLFSVGRYAMSIKWTDGHASGIYTYEYLHKLDHEKQNQDLQLA